MNYIEIAIALPLLGLHLGACSATDTSSPMSGGSSGSGGSISAGSSGSAGAPAGTGGTMGASGSNGSGGGGASDAGSVDVGSGGGSKDASGEEGARDTGTTGKDDAGVGGASLCTPGKYILCENFEATAAGAVPAGFTKHGSASVVVDQAARGSHSLKINAAANGERRIYTDGAKLGSAHWGRIFYRVELPVPTVFVHSTLVALYGIGPVNGAEEVRVADTVKDANGKHQFLYNVQPSGAEFGKGSDYNWTFDGSWHCAEWHIDANTQSYSFYYDSAEVTSIAINNGAGNYTGSDIPMAFTDLRVGWNNYQSAPPGFVAFIDEIAIDVNRIGCDK